jgi:tRNA U34 2-thiouridine synthase MnmA/TrmU
VEKIKTPPLTPPLKGEENNSIYKVKFKKSQRAIASGQICAIYI